MTDDMSKASPSSVCLSLLACCCCLFPIHRALKARRLGRRVDDDEDDEDDEIAVSREEKEEKAPRPEAVWQKNATKTTRMRKMTTTFSPEPYPDSRIRLLQKIPGSLQKMPLTASSPRQRQRVAVMPRQ